ncbi:ABC-ATPase domain-containing protein [Alteribacillus sp. HJP-4]|uniref:ABC-ATPase domain-containing protein n=1 Tax=Alteribacillus sp. HJP-4 TaxID=2775394 RepID=UPI0035CCC897
MKQLIQHLNRIDRKGYKAYNDIKGRYSFPNFTLHIDHIQPDPYASPSRIRISVGRQLLSLGAEADSSQQRRVASVDFFAKEIQLALKKQRSSSLQIDGPGQEILDRTAVLIREKEIEIRMSVHLPARGRTILGKEAVQLLSRDLPKILETAVLHYSADKLRAQLELADQQQAIREFLIENGLITFIAEDSVLPRESGISNRPLKENAVSFQSPDSMRVEIPLPHRPPIRGMAVKEGINIIVGGGYHGKSTLLEAIERGVYNHRSGDGREFVITRAGACKVRAEDGRSVAGVNISPFISNLPIDKSTDSFSTDNASGSTSQAANIMESLEAGTNCLLIDEDTSATNFMIRDGRMQALVAKDKEPITPFIDKVNSLYTDHGVSTILVVGGAGDYFDVADSVVMLEEYRPTDVTKKAKEIAALYGSSRQMEAGSNFGPISERVIQTNCFQSKKGKKSKVAAKGKQTILYGRDAIDLTGVEQLLNSSQTNAIANMIQYACRYLEENASMEEVLQFLEAEVSEYGLDRVSPFFGSHPGDMAMPRRYEIAAAINRHRRLVVN